MSLSPLYLLILLFIGYGSDQQPIVTYVIDKHDLFVHIDNIKDANGQILIALYNDEGTFLSDITVADQKKPVEGKSNVVIKMVDLPFGTYAASVVHDINNNNKMDTRIFGIPKEPYGFSNNARPKFSAPKYEDAKFIFDKEGQEIHIKIK